MALSIDGTAVGSWSSGLTLSVTLTTTRTNDIIVLAIYTDVYASPFSTVSSISGGGLTWNKRGVVQQAVGGFHYVDLEIWWAYAPAVLSSTSITINLSETPNGVGAGVLAYGVNGANTSSPWDSNSSLPAVAGSGSAGAIPSVSGVSTSNANNMLFGFQVGIGGSQNYPGSSFGIINSGGSVPDGEYSTVSSVQSSVTVAFGSGESLGSSYGFAMYADAIQAASSSAVGNFGAFASFPGVVKRFTMIGT